MAVRLDIEVKSSGSVGGSGSGGLSPQDAAAIQRSLENANRLTTVLLKGARDFRAEFKAATDGLGAGLQAQTTAADRTAARLGLSYQRSLEQAAKAGGAAIERETGRGLARGLSASSAGLAGAGRGVVAGFSRFGSEASSAFGVAFQGGLLNGNLLRGAGGLAGSVARLGGSLGQGLAKAVGAAFNLIPVVGPALAGLSSVIGSAFSVAGSLAGVLANAAGEIAGFFADQLATALKVAVGAAVAVGVAGIRLALKAEDVEPAFEKIAKATGDSVPSALAKLRTATQGTISDLDLMRSANEAVALKAADNVDQFGKLADVAIRLGRNVGRGAADSINDLVVGLGRASPRILDNIGLQVQLESVYAKGAAALGKNAEALTDSEKRTALLNGVLDQAAEKLAGQGERTTKASESMRRLGAASENAGLAIGRALLPSVERVAAPLAGVAESLARFIERERQAPSGVLEKTLKDIEGVLKTISDFLDRANFDDFKALAASAFEAVAISGKAAMGGLFDYIALRAKQAASSVGAIAAEALPYVGGIVGKVVGGNLSDSLRSDAAGFGAAAEQVRFTPQGADAARLGSAIDATRGRAASVLSRSPAGAAASRPTSQPTVARNDNVGPRAPLQSFSAPAQPGIFPVTQFGAQQSLTAAAAPLGVDIAGIVQQISVAVARAAEPAKALDAAVDAFRAASVKDSVAELGRAITEPLKRSADNFEENVRTLEGSQDKLEDGIANARESLNRLAEKLSDGLDDIADAFDRDRSAILDRRDQRIAAANQRTQQRAGELLGDAGGVGPDASAIPPKLRRAAAKARRAANRERRESLRQLSDGQSVDELAANGAAGLQAVFQEQAARETGQAGAIQAAYQEAALALRDLSNQRLVAEEALREAIATDSAEQAELIDRSTKILEGIAKDLESAKATRDEIKARLDKVEKALDAARTASARAAR